MYLTASSTVLGLRTPIIAEAELASRTPNFWAPACMHPSPVAALALRPSGACQRYQSPSQPPGPRRGGRLSAWSAQPFSSVGCGGAFTEGFGLLTSDFGVGKRQDLGF